MGAVMQQDEHGTAAPRGPRHQQLDVTTSARLDLAHMWCVGVQLADTLRGNA